MPHSPSGYREQLVQAVFPPRPTPVDSGTCIFVHDAISRFAFLYEKIRNAVDYKDDHLIRKAAILRILKRHLVLEKNPAVIADHLVREMISARYLPNGSLPESVVQRVAVPVTKLQAISRSWVLSGASLAWLRGIVAVEIEELLVDTAQEKALITFLYDRLLEVVHVRGVQMDETERKLQIYVACYRSLVKADDEMLSYKLLRAYMPEWMRPQEWLAEPRLVAQKLTSVQTRVRAQLAHPMSQRFLRATKPLGMSLGLLRDVLVTSKDEAILLSKDAPKLRKELTKAIEERYAKATVRLRRGTRRATLYLFFTKMIIALLLEAPLELWLYKEIHAVALGINLLFPPILMILVGLLIHIPGQANTDRLLQGAEELLGDKPITVKEIVPPRVRGFFNQALFTLLYLCTYIVSFGLIIKLLQRFDFTWIAITIFLFFLCVVSFFAFRLRLLAREIVVVEDRVKLRTIIIDFFSLPILRAGQWLSRNISRINIFLFVFDFLFEAPFKLFLAVLEDWFGFLKEKKEELQ